MKKVLVIGKNSFLARAFISHNRERFDVTSISHDDDLTSLPWGEFACVLNMAYDPNYFRGAYAPELDFDLNIARAVEGTGSHFILMSTRRVYGASAPFPSDEFAPVAPTDQYGTNKAITERSVQAVLGANCTILRIANVFGFEPGRHTFCGVALSTLKREGRITLDISPFTRRDFLSVDSFAEMLGQTVELSPPGIFNMGSGKAIPVGQIALWLIEGYGAGEMVVTSTRERDSFWLDCAKLNKLIECGGNQATKIRDCCLEIGRRLANG